MRLPPFGPLAPFGSLATAVLLLAFFGPLGPEESKAQDAPAPAPTQDAAAEEAPKADSIPLGRFIARDRLFLYVESAGLESRDAAWKKTAAQRMLNETSLGVMLEEVGAQLADRLLDYLPNRKITGAETVTIVEHLARKGWAFGLSADPQAPNGVRGVLVLRGVVGKDTKALFSRLMGSFWSAEVKPKIERKGSRVMVVVPPEKPQKDVKDQGWVWWPEGEDLVVGLIQPSDADSIHAALDGQSPSIEGFEPVADLSKPEDGFEPVLTAWFDPVAAGAAVGGGEGSGQPLAALAKFFADANVKRIDHRWGFDGDSLVSITRLAAPKPRKGILALFNDPSHDAKNVLAFPEGVDYFASMSIKPEQWPEVLGAAMGSGEGRAEFDALVEELRARRVEFDKDLLGNLGPRILFYMAPGGSAATPAAAAGAGLLPAPLGAALAGRIPRPVLVAEVVDPSKMGRALEALVFEVNKRIKSAMMEQAAAIVKAEADARRAGAGGLPGAEAGGAPAARKRDAEPPLPEFRLIPGSTSPTERIYMLNTPTNSPVKPLPPGVKPTIRLEGNRLAFSTSPEAARLAIETLRDKDWTPPSEVADAVAKTPEDSVFVFYGDSRETTPTSLASLPGTLQAQINMALALAARGAQPQRNAGGQGPGGVENEPNPDGYADPSLPPGDSGMGAGPGGQGRQAAAPPNLIQIRVAPDHLPRADELRAFMFPTTTSVAVDDQTVRIVTREAFPDTIVLATTNGALAAILIPAINAANQAGAGDPEEAGEAEPGAGSSAPGGDPALRIEGGPASLPGDSAPRNRRRDDE